MLQMIGSSHHQRMMHCWAHIRDIKNMAIFLNTWYHLKLNNFGTWHLSRLSVFHFIHILYSIQYVLYSMMVYSVDHLK